MTVLMQCLGCGIVVTNPRTMNYMFEKCDPCTDKQREMEEMAIDTFLHAQAEKKLEQDA